MDDYRNNLRPFEEEYEVAPGVIASRTGGHTPGHSVVRLASGSDALTFAGDAVFQVGFEHPDWYNGFEHDPEEAARVQGLNEQVVFGVMAVASIASGLLLQLIGWQSINLLAVVMATGAIAVLGWGQYQGGKTARA